MTTNTTSTRYYSQLQEEYVAKVSGGKRVANSGAGHFSKGDVVVKDIGMLIECKTSMQPKSTFGVKKEWLEKNRQETFSSRLSHCAVAFSFEPEGDHNYYIIDERLFKYLISKLREEAL